MSEITVEEIEEGLTSQNLLDRKLFAENVSLDELNEAQIDRGLSDKMPLIRYIFAKRVAIRNAAGSNFYRTFTIEQQRRGLKDDNNSVRALFVQFNDAFTRENDKDIYLKDQSAEVLVSLLKNTNLKLKKEQIKELASSPIKRVRDAFSKKVIMNTRYEKENVLINKNNSIRGLRTFKITDENHYSVSDFLSEHRKDGILAIGYYKLERGLRDSHADVRRTFVKRHYQFYTKKQIARGIKDDDIEIRSLFASNDYAYLTSAQLDNIFKDDIFEVVYSLSKRENLVLTPKQINYALESKHPKIRCAFAKRGYKLTNMQIKRGLDDPNNEVVAAFISRKGSLKFLDHEKVDMFSKSAHNNIRVELVRKEGVVFTDNQINQLLTDENPCVREFMAKRHDIKLDGTQIENGLIDKDPIVRGEFAKRWDFRPSEKQIDRGIEDDNNGIIIAFLNRKDIVLNVRQIKGILEHRDDKVKYLLKHRRDYIEYAQGKIENVVSKNSNRI